MERKSEPAAGDGAEPIAIVGYGGVFPGARSLDEFWHRIEYGEDTSCPVPAGRWILDPNSIQDATPGTPDRVYTDRGCFIQGFQLDPTGLDLPGDLLSALDASIHLLLEAGRNAWASARTDPVDRRRVGVVLGNIALPTEAVSELCEEVMGEAQILSPGSEGNPNPARGRAGLNSSHRVREDLSSAGPADSAQALAAFRSRRSDFDPRRYVSGLPAGVLAQALGLGGGTCTLDAACASSLYALKLACDELRAGRADAMLAGGLSRPDSLYTQMGFCQLRALAHTGRCTPFEAASSGLIVGEGAGVLVLKRLADARRDGDSIHAIIRGIGLSNDLDGNLLSPSSEGQLRALKQAYQQAGWSPGSVDLIECHATGTPVGDAVEFESLSKLWRGESWQPGQCVLGAVKANIGHLLTAAGSASLIKVLLALKHGILPATANFRQPAEKIPLAGSPFRILQESQPWPRRAVATPRRAAINGFGFGGINAHVLIEEWLGDVNRERNGVGTRRASACVPGAGSGIASEPASNSLPEMPAAEVGGSEFPARHRKPLNGGECSPEPTTAVPVAIVGLAAHVGSWPTLQAFQERVFGGGSEVLPARDGRPFPGFFLTDLALPVNRYRIPPKELAELLPQQALMLEVARAALADAQTPKPAPARAGVCIGLGLDLRTTDFHFRWATLAAGRESQAPALTADRTLGALAGINASRIAKEFHFGGQSFTVCTEDCSGTKALEIAVRALQTGELDMALAGAVDVAGDPRTLLGTNAVRPFSLAGVARPFDTHGDGVLPGEGAVALVLKRLDDAQRDGDRIYAIVRGIGSASGGGIGGAFEAPVAPALDVTHPSRIGAPRTAEEALDRAYAEAGVDPASVGYLETNSTARPEDDLREIQVLDTFFGSSRRKFSCRLGSAMADVGHTGAATGLVAVVKASLALYQEVLPPLRGLLQPLAGLATSPTLLARPFPQPWVRDRVNGPRRAGVSTASVDGNFMHVVLEACEGQTSERAQTEREQPVETRRDALFVAAAAAPAGLLKQIEALRSLATSVGRETIVALARRWWGANAAGSAGETPTAPWVVALVTQDVAQLLRLLESARDCVQRSASPDTSTLPRQDRDRLFFTPPDQRIKGGIAFVFPGAGNTFPEMGRELALRWPEILRAQDRENEFLASQMCADRFWNVASPANIGTDHRAVICGQVALGTMVSDLAVSFGLKPDAMVGYSLGEATGLFALRAWAARDEMLRRVTRSTLFSEDLTGKPEQLRRVWRVPVGQPSVEWLAGLVDRPATEVRAAIASRERIYILIVNTPRECVIGGDATEVRALVAKLSCHWWPLDGVSTVHCELLRPFEEAYRELHRFPTAAPASVRFFSGGWGREYIPDRETAAAAIVAQASDCVDFPRVVRAAYDAGMRVFLEMGPGNSCSRMIGQILHGRPHVARSLCASAQEPILAILGVLGQLVAEGIAVDLKKLSGGEARAVTNLSAPVETRCVRIRVVSPLFATDASGRVPAPAAAGRTLAPRLDAWMEEGPGVEATAPEFSDGTPTTAAEAGDPFETEFFQGMADSQAAAINAHQAYLNFTQGVGETLAQTVRSQLGLISALAGEETAVGTNRHLATARHGAGNELASRSREHQSVPSEPARMELPDEGSHSLDRRTPTLDRAACLEFARGAVAQVLGAQFSAVDDYPTRVRLPDEPLMLVDRILEIEGEARSMTHGRVVTEHDILSGAWYLDGGHIPTCIAVEAGQADLFLSGFLGIDFETKGLAVYRLLDAKVCFHCGLPGPGAVIRYDIRIDGFFRQGSTWLFRFNFEATVAGRPFLTMTEGCAGFFSAAELSGGRGIVRTAMDLEPRPGKRPADWEELVAVGVESYSAEQLDALRVGDLATCFGPEFSGLNLQHPITLPAGQMKLVHRIPRLDPTGGRFGLGWVRGEADIHPDDWFLTCHFVDDRVMPGTLMFECCLHTLRVLLLRLGWVVEQDLAVLEPVPGVVSQLKCRGQVLDTTAVVTYEISIKEIGYQPEPYVIADALMFADGKAIVEIGNMSLRYAGVTRDLLQATWAATRSHPAQGVLYDSDRILSFAVGKPSEAFGAPYRVFDEERRIARLPGPPYQFLDHITEVTGEPFKMVPGGVAVAEYAVPPEAWYFAANHQNDMPFAVVLEIALQPCGWLAAYVGSALTSETDLSFRNLGGTGTQLAPVTPTAGTLVTRVKLTRVSSSAGMIIQWFDLEVRGKSGRLYQGNTYFGFFPAAALARQEGIRDAKRYQPSPAELAASTSLPYPAQPPFAGAPLRMVDSIEIYCANGGPSGLGFIRATKRVVAEEWFFKAHFYQDPVVPGSLGLESFLQLLKFLAIERWGHTDGTRWEAVAIGEPHEWVYRGQIIPNDTLVTIEALVTAVDESARMLTADGLLSVDGRVIYGMKHFTVRAQRDEQGKT